MILLRAVAIWMLIITVETVQGILRTIFLIPVMRDFPARQLSVITGCILIFTIAYFFTSWIGAKSKQQLLTVGVLWVVLTVLFEVALGKVLLALPWERIFEDYDLTRGGLLGFGLLFMLLSPLLAAKVRKIALVSS